MARSSVRLFAATAVGVLALAIIASPATAQSAPSCGAKIYKANGTAWKCTFADDFNGHVLDTKKWSVQRTATGMHAGQECLVNSTHNVSVSGGNLHLTARKEKARFTCQYPFGNYTTQWTSGGVTTTGKFAQAYGRFEFRAKFPDTQVAGVQTSLWLYPTTLKYGAWPASGEIDVAEFYSRYPDRTIPYIHYFPAHGASAVTNQFCKLKPTAYHSYVAEWTKKSITISHDGVVCLSHAINPAGLFRSAPAPFDQPFAVLLTQVLGNATNVFNPATTPLPARTDIDWVRVWS